MTVEINYLGVQITVEGLYYPGDPEIMYDLDMAGYPGSNSEFEIHDVFVGEVSIIELLSDYQMEEIISEAIEKIEE
jgi:hypothetical protein